MSSSLLRCAIEFSRSFGFQLRVKVRFCTLWLHHIHIHHNITTLTNKPPGIYMWDALLRLRRARASSSGSTWSTFSNAQTSKTGSAAAIQETRWQLSKFGDLRTTAVRGKGHHDHDHGWYVLRVCVCVCLCVCCGVGSFDAIIHGMLFRFVIFLCIQKGGENPFQR